MATEVENKPVAAVGEEEKKAEQPAAAVVAAATEGATAAAAAATDKTVGDAGAAGGDADKKAEEKPAGGEPGAGGEGGDGATSSDAAAPAKKEKEVKPTVHKVNFEKDVVYLYQFTRTPMLPSISPFCLKVETWLRLAGLKYEVSGGSQLLTLVVQYSQMEGIVDQLAYQVHSGEYASGIDNGGPKLVDEMMLLVNTLSVSIPVDEWLSNKFQSRASQSKGSKCKLFARAWLDTATPSSGRRK
uniref:Thioredoxin-like fold domain-containing protein n=1 Tax=Anopheles atroparvus TaxID=41427 RepID=A0A182J2V9_ANOAO